MSTFGPAYQKEVDEPALTQQRERIKNFMLGIGWVRLSAIASTLGYPEASVSAQLRHLRKEQFGGYRVMKKRMIGGRVWLYHVMPPLPKGQLRLFE